jgi:GNAT superfamily N-acetyltransferase
MSEPDYTVRAYRPDDREAVLALLERSLGPGPAGERTAAFFDWKHGRNPFGPSPALVADTGEGLIGLRALMRWRFAAGQRAVEALRAVDTATDPAHQGKGVFRRLTLAALEKVGDDAALVFNTPNADSLPGYLKFGWREVGRVGVDVAPTRPLRLARHTRRVASGRGDARPVPSELPRAAEVLADHTALAPLLAAQPADERLHTPRTHEFLRWRYAEAPGLDYRAVTLDGPQGLTGLAIGRLRRRGPLAELTLADALVRPGDNAGARRLLRRVARAGGDYAAAHLAGDAALRRAGRRAGYVPAPRQGLTLVANPLQDVEPDPTRRDSWRLALGDLEVF